MLPLPKHLGQCRTSFCNCLLHGLVVGGWRRCSGGRGRSGVCNPCSTYRGVGNGRSPLESMHAHSGGSRPCALAGLSHWSAGVQALSKGRLIGHHNGVLMQWYRSWLQHFAAGMPMRAAKLQAKRMQRQAARAQATATEQVTRQKVMPCALTVIRACKDLACAKLAIAAHKAHGLTLLLTGFMVMPFRCRLS